MRTVATSAKCSSRAGSWLARGLVLLREGAAGDMGYGAQGGRKLMRR